LTSDGQRNPPSSAKSRWAWVSSPCLLVVIHHLWCENEWCENTQNQFEIRNV
jgi:hypothetical protein